MDGNPQMRRLMESHPQLREVLNDPQLLRQSMEMMQNPQAMQHMMRSQDLALSQLENMPGGFAALSNMYRNVQEPMMEAMQSSSPMSETPSSTTQSSSGSGATGTAMPNPWQSPTAAAANPLMGGASASASANPWGMPMNDANPWGAPPSPQQMEQTLEMLENPMVAQMMEQLWSNPVHLRQMMDANPMMQQLRRSNPQAARMMENPEMMREMMNPQNLRAMMQLNRSMQQSQGTGAATATPTTGTGTGSDGLDFSSLLNQFQAANLGGSPFGGAVQPPPSPPQHPADRYRRQIASLRDMGFDDEQASLRALVVNHGNLNRAVDMLIEGRVPDEVPGLSDAPPPSTADAPSRETTEDAPPKDANDKKND